MKPSDLIEAGPARVFQKHSCPSNVAQVSPFPPMALGLDIPLGRRLDNLRLGAQMNVSIGVDFSPSNFPMRERV